MLAFTAERIETQPLKRGGFLVSHKRSARYVQTLFMALVLLAAMGSDALAGNQEYWLDSRAVVGAGLVSVGQQSALGYSAGIERVWKRSGMADLVVGARYASRGGRNRGTVYNETTGQELYSGNMRVALGYLEVPIIIRMKQAMGRRSWCEAGLGPFVGLRLNSHYRALDDPGQDGQRVVRAADISAGGIASIGVGYRKALLFWEYTQAMTDATTTPRAEGVGIDVLAGIRRCISRSIGLAFAF